MPRWSTVIVPLPSSPYGVDSPEDGSHPLKAGAASEQLLAGSLACDNGVSER